MLIFQIKRIISSEKWFNYVAMVFYFLFLEKTEDGLSSEGFRSGGV